MAYSIPTPSKCNALILIFIFLLILGFSSMGQQPWMSSHVFFNENNRLEYAPDEQGNIIPDFSNVGYKFGDEKIPDIGVAIEISPVEGDNGQHIQDAINYVSGLALDSNGYRGAVLLKAGTYLVGGQLRIQADGVVLRGEGQTEEGAVIVAAGTNRRTLLLINGSGSLSGLGGTDRNIVESYVPVGRKFLVVTNTEGYQVGDDIVIHRPGTQQWINDIRMDQIVPAQDGSTVQWTPESYHLRYERVVSAISGDSIFFRNPVVMAMEDKYGGGRIYKSSFNGRLKHIGVENILFKSEYTSDTDEDHSWNAVEFQRTMHSWVRNITAKHFAYATVSIHGTAKHISVIDCTSLEPQSLVTGGRRYAFNNNGQLNLFMGCFGSEGRHDYVTGARVFGPSAFVNSTSVLSRSDNGPHHRWATGILWDNITGDRPINVQDRGNSGTGHGWAGANIVFWNCTAPSSVTQSPWASAKNYNIGFTGNKNLGDWFTNRPDGVWEGRNVPGLNPQSLYLAQLEERKWDSDRFQVFEQIDMIDAETLRVTFNKNIDITQGSDPQNYQLNGTAGLSGSPISAQVAFGNKVFLTVPNMDFLQAGSTISITLSEHLISEEGKELEGLKTLTLIFPDLRPGVFSKFQNLNTATHDYAAVQVSKPATVYLVIVGTIIANVNDLENAVSEGKGVKKYTTKVYEDVQVPIQSLPSGTYYFYALDNVGRISDRSAIAVFITNNTVSTSGRVLQPVFWLENGHIVFYDGHFTRQNIRVQLLDITGRVIFHHILLDGETSIKIPGVRGIHIIQILSDNYNFNTKVFLPNKY